MSLTGAMKDEPFSPEGETPSFGTGNLAGGGTGDEVERLLDLASFTEVESVERSRSPERRSLDGEWRQAVASAGFRKLVEEPVDVLSKT